VPPSSATHEGVFARSRWIWGPGVDLAVFAGTAALALLLVALAPRIVEPGGELPVWGFIAFVIGVDVAHVYATLFRTYLDPTELRQRPTLYAGVPLACFAIGVWLYQASPLWFWRVLAYAALLHFVRQQSGVGRDLRARLGERDRVDRWIDAATVYAATGYPVLIWHASPPRAFAWLIPGDFFRLSIPEGALTAAGWLYALVLLLYLARSIQHVASGGRVNVGKHAVVGSTALCWYVGIVATNGDFEFTVTNVLIHGVPYLALLWAYTRERGREIPTSLVGRVAAAGVVVFLGVGVVLAMAEELFWDRLVWHDHPSLFGGLGDSVWDPSSLTMSLLVPLLAVPQATHYVLDAVLWRRQDTGPAQARALGFEAPPRHAAASEAVR
jgi:hypothetical protein